MQFDFSKQFTKERLQEFANVLEDMNYDIGFKVSARGWGYLMEQGGYITKSEFNKVENAINKCRREGYLPVDFVSAEEARAFKGVEKPSDGDTMDTLRWMLRDVLLGQKYFIPEWWEDEEYYIQVLVEKIDLKTLFYPICSDYKIPIANAKGWSSILQRAEYANRFKQAEEQGLKCVLLYCGDHDPDGLRISDTIRKNLQQIEQIKWEDGNYGYDPSNLIIDRFGLNYDFIQENDFTWIDNLITGSIAGLDLADHRHRNHYMPYVQKYLHKVGARKCEANVIVTKPDIAAELMREAIEKYLGPDASDRFEAKREVVKKDYEANLKTTGLIEPITKLLNND